jgi:hypothetical protein
MTAFEILKYPDTTIDLLFEGDLNTKSDVFRLEGEHIQITENCINKQVAITYITCNFFLTEETVFL